MVAFLSLLLSLRGWLPAGDLQSGDDQGVGASGGVLAPQSHSAASAEFVCRGRLSNVFKLLTVVMLAMFALSEHKEMERADRQDLMATLRSSQADMAWLGLVSVLLTKLMKYLAAKAAGALTLRVKVNRKINLEHLRAFLTSRSVDVFDRIEDTESRLLKMTWVEVDAELWKGSPPAVELQYDDRFGFLLSVFFQIDTKTTPLRERGLMDVFNKMMADAGVFEKDDEAADG